jgi:hypothetical protein
MALAAAIRASVLGKTPSCSPSALEQLPDYTQAESDDVRAKVFPIVQAAHLAVAEEYEDRLLPAQQAAVRHFLCGPAVARVEEAVDQQIETFRTSKDPLVRAKALKNIKEGMDYWKTLIFREMDKPAPESVR